MIARFIEEFLKGIFVLRIIVKKLYFKLEIEFIISSEREDLNLRPLDPQSSALPDCATSRFVNY